jgi:alanine racemase
VPEQGDFGLVPAMTLRTHLANVKRVGAGEGVSYGHQYVTERETTLALIPLGYADGIPRAATNVGPVAINGNRYTISGRVCMDQFVVDVGDTPVTAGTEAVLFGPGTAGEPTAQDWANVLDTIHYEVITRIGARVPRSYVGGESE